MDPLTLIVLKQVMDYILVSVYLIIQDSAQRDNVVWDACLYPGKE